MNTPFPSTGPASSHEYPLGPQENMAHVIVVMPAGTTDGIISGPRDKKSHREEPVFKHPGENRENAIKAAA